MARGWLWRGQAPTKRVVGGRATVVAVLALAVASPAAPAAVISFDDLPAGTVVDDEYAARGVIFGPSPFPDMSGVFTTIAKGQARSAPNVPGLAYNPMDDFSSSGEHPVALLVQVFALRAPALAAPPL